MKVITEKDELGKVVYDSKLIKDIVKCSLGEVKGVVTYPENSKQANDSIKIEHIGDEIYVNVFIKILSSVNVHDTASQIQRTIKDMVESTYGFKVQTVDVHVIDVQFEEH